MTYKKKQGLVVGCFTEKHSDKLFTFTGEGNKYLLQSLYPIEPKMGKACQIRVMDTGKIVSDMKVFKIIAFTRFAKYNREQRTKRLIESKQKKAHDKPVGFYYKGVPINLPSGQKIRSVLKALIDATDYLTAPELDKQLGITGSGMHINNLRKRYGIRIDVDDSNKAKHRWKIKEGYRLS